MEKVKKRSIILTTLIAFIAIFSCGFLFSSFSFKTQMVKASTITEVATYEQLQSALAEADENSEIVVTETITLPNEADLDGNGAIVRVVHPYIAEDGIVRDGERSEYDVFNISGWGINVTLKNMTILGGYSTNAAIYNAQGNLTMENVTITRSLRGLYNSHGKVILKNCNIVRNLCDFGGGILCAGGIIVMDGCSLSENYSTRNSGGGGAIEINSSGFLYANNTVIINNSSSEIGGAINCYDYAKIWLANCTISGNVTTAKNAYYGGGVGLNSSNLGGFYAVNTIITDNYQIVGDVKTRSDVGYYAETANNFVNCLIGEITKKDSSYPEALDHYINTTDCKIDMSSTFAAKYRNDGVLIKNDEITIDFLHPAAITKTNGIPALFVPVKAGKGASSDGVKTYFDYSNINNIKMGYGEPDSITGLGGLEVPVGEEEINNAQVKTYYEGGTRVDGVIGASLVTDTNFYTVTLAKGFANGSVSGATVYGDTYEENTQVTVQGNADDNYVVEYWVYLNKDMHSNTNSTKILTDNPFTFNIIEDVTLIPIFTLKQTPVSTSQQPQGLPIWVYVVIAALSIVILLLLTSLAVTNKHKKIQTNIAQTKTNEVKTSNTQQQTANKAPQQNQAEKNVENKPDKLNNPTTNKENNLKKEQPTPQQTKKD